MNSARSRWQMLAWIVLVGAAAAARGEDVPGAPAAAEGAPSAEDASPTAEAAKTLRFNFQRQPWQDVLQWLSEEADLSLVLDAPPPGTFNYADARSYTTDEAIDLVNGVLAGKGYTLLRRERMLMLVNLQDEAAQSLAPRLSLEEAERRGKYEFVTVSFPLGGRDAQAALAEIKPLVSQFGKASALPASNQLMVTDRAGLMRTLATVVASMPAPAGAAAPAAKPEQPEFRAYPLQGADAKAAVEILTAVSNGKFAHDPAGEILNAFATPSQHAMIEQLMQQIRGAADQERYRLEIYPLEGLDATRQAQLLTDLAAPAAGSQLRFDAANQQLIVWATAPRHQSIRKALLTLLAAGSGGGGAKEAKVYALEHATAGDVLPLLQSVAPQAQLSVGGAPHRLLAVAAPRDHALIDQLLPQLDVPDERELLDLRPYRLDQPPPEELPELLAEAAPRARVRIDAVRRMVLVAGSEEDHAIIAQLLANLRERLPAEPETPLRIRVLSSLQKDRFASVRPALEEAAPDAKIVWNEVSGELFVWARPEQQAAVDELLAERELRAYPTTAAQLDALATLAGKVAPQAVITIDRPGRRVLAWAEGKDHQRLATLLPAAPTAAEAAEGTQIDRSYPAGEIDLTLAARLVQERFPAAQVDPDTTARSLVVRTTAEDHRQVEELVRQLRSGATTRATSQVEVYPLGGAAPQQVEQLRLVFPALRIGVDASSQQVAVSGTREEREQFAEALAALGGSRTNGGWTVRVFALQQAKAAEIAAGLPLLVQGIAAAPINDAQLLVRCRTDVETEVARLVEQLDVHRGVSQRKQARTFPLKRADAAALLTTLQTLLPPVQGCAFSFDAQTRSLMAVADAPQMALIENVVAAAEKQDAPGGDARELRVYPLPNAQGPAVLATLEKLFKERGATPQLSVDAAQNRLVAVGTAAEQSLVADALRQLAPDATQVEVFSLETIDPYDAELAIGQLFNGRSGGGAPVEIEADPSGGRLLVRGTVRQLADIRGLLVKMGESQLLPAGQEGSAPDFIPWKEVDPQTALEQFLASWRQVSDAPVQLVDGPSAAERQPPPTTPPAAAGPSPDPAKPLEPADAPTATEGSGAPPAADPAATSPAPAGPAADPAPAGSADPAPAGSADPADAAPAAQPGPAPVQLMVSPQGVAVDSADEAAAAQAAALLRAAARGEVRGTREFSVYPLKNASAERLATVLSGIYRDYGRGGRLRFAADERINAVIVKGAKAERREAEALLESLDTSREVEYYKPDQPVVLTLRHANAKQVYAQLQNLYRSELQRGSKQPPIEIPPGADPELVATLQQINASREGPLLSLEVDSDTNSLLVIAPRPLVKEISEFAEQVDARSTESRIGVRVVPLESLQGKEVLQSLQRIFGERRP